MCGRYYETEDEEVIRAEFDIKRESKDLPKIRPRYNIAPMQMAPVIRLNPDTGEKELVMMRWGLIPSWAKDRSIASSTINARSETVASKPSFRNAFKKRRCLIPASGFFEWKKLDKKDKQPYRINVKGKNLFAMAGLWESWKNPESGEDEETFTIITCDPNEIVANLHDRMPAILPKELCDLWLHSPIEDPNELLSLLKAFPADQMTITPIGREVGNVRNDYPSLIEKVESETLF